MKIEVLITDDSGLIVERITNSRVLPSEAIPMVEAIHTVLFPSLSLPPKPSSKEQLNWWIKQPGVITIGGCMYLQLQRR